MYSLENLTNIYGSTLRLTVACVWLLVIGGCGNEIRHSQCDMTDITQGLEVILVRHGSVTDVDSYVAYHSEESTRIREYENVIQEIMRCSRTEVGTKPLIVTTADLLASTEFLRQHFRFPIDSEISEGQYRAAKKNMTLLSQQFESIGK